MTTTAQEIAERLAAIKVHGQAKAMLEDLDPADPEFFHKLNRAVADAMLEEGGLREAVVRMESAHENLMHLSGEAAQARRHISLALAALKGKKA